MSIGMLVRLALILPSERFSTMKLHGAFLKA